MNIIQEVLVGNNSTCKVYGPDSARHRDVEGNVHIVQTNLNQNVIQLQLSRLGTIVSSM